MRIDRLLVGKRRRWESCDLKLRERSPYELLKRGYAIVYDASGKVVRSVDEVAVGDAIEVRLAQGEIDATVRGIESDPEIVIATTGIGFRGWLDAASAWGLADRLRRCLSGAELIARGPRSRAALRAAGG